jgi:hypothetical protein
MRVERMRQAILQGIMNPEMVFAKPILPLMQHPFGPGPGGMAPPLYQQNVNFRPAGAPPNNAGPGRGLGRGRGLLGKSMWFSSAFLSRVANEQLKYSGSSK